MARRTKSDAEVASASPEPSVAVEKKHRKRPSTSSKASEPPADDIAGTLSSAVAKPRKRKTNSTNVLPPIADLVAETKETALSKLEPSAAANPDAVSQQPKTKIPASLQFPLATTLSFALASLGFSLLGEFTKGELAAVSRSQDTWAEVGVLATWRVIELAIGWFGKFDSLDVATLDLLAHGPSLYLLTAFYNLSPLTALSALAVDITSAAVPFHLLRPLADVHARPSAETLPNGELLVDWTLQALTAALSTGIYTITIALSLQFILPRILVLHFTGLPSLEPAYSASYATVLPATLLFGIAASTFIFPPFVAAPPASDGSDDAVKGFDPAAATLSQTFWWNAWGYTAKTKVAIRRTIAAVAVTAINTYLACTMTIHGIESAGAAAYAGVWAVAALCTGLGLGLVGGGD